MSFVIRVLAAERRRGRRGGVSLPAERAPSEVPVMLGGRPPWLRAYYETDSIATSGVTEEDGVGHGILALPDAERVSFRHAQFAGPGCFACRGDRDEPR